METIEAINQRLIDYYGIDSDTGRPIFRIVWANDETEKRRVTTSEFGIQFVHPIVMEVKKYPYLKDLHVLERLVVVPDADREELVVSKLSYEPLWAFHDAAKNPVYPIWTATQFVVDALYAALGKKSMAKYVESEDETTQEGRQEQIAQLQGELFGNENETTDALAYGEGIVVPSNYKKES